MAEEEESLRFSDPLTQPGAPANNSGGGGGGGTVTTCTVIHVVELCAFVLHNYNLYIIDDMYAYLGITFTTCTYLCMSTGDARLQREGGGERD